MGASKWIGGYLGFILGGGPLGALAGFALGWLFEKGLNNFSNDDDDTNGRSRNRGYTREQRYEGERNSFLFSMLVLAAYIIKADGRIMHSEMEMVRRFLGNNFGQQAKIDGERVILRLFEQQKQMGAERFRATINDACLQMQYNISYAQRLQLLNFLVMIAQADGVIVKEENDALLEVAINLGITQTDIDSMLNLQSAENNLEAAYKVLGVSPNASNDEVKAAYRRMALKHHPDRVATLGDDVRKAAEKKFQEINNAKELIFKARGI